MKIEKRRILKFKEKDRKKKRAIGKNEEIFNKTNTSLFELLMSKNLIPNQSLITKISNLSSYVHKKFTADRKQTQNLHLNQKFFCIFQQTFFKHSTGAASLLHIFHCELQNLQMHSLKTIFLIKYQKS